MQAWAVSRTSLREPARLAVFCAAGRCSEQTHRPTPCSWDSDSPPREGKAGLGRGRSGSHCRCCPTPLASKCLWNGLLSPPGVGSAWPLGQHGCRVHVSLGGRGDKRYPEARAGGSIRGALATPSRGQATSGRMEGRKGEHRVWAGAWESRGFSGGRLWGTRPWEAESRKAWEAR